MKEKRQGYVIENNGQSVTADIDPALPKVKLESPATKKGEVVEVEVKLSQDGVEVLDFERLFPGYECSYCDGDHPRLMTPEAFVEHIDEEHPDHSPRI